MSHEELELIAALSDTGHEIRPLGNGELLVGRTRWLIMLPLLRPARATDAQADFYGTERWISPRVIVRNVEEALDAARRYC